MAPQRATSRPYEINGIMYYPQPHYELEEEGIASFYGGGDVFHGRPTATGERFDMNGLTAAHKTVPLPCMAKVTNLENGRELIVKVNDRGPFVAGRVLDLSRRGAQLLGFEHKGLARVRVVTLVPESLALNGLDPSTVMVAEAPPALIPAATVATATSSEPETLSEALTGPPSVDKRPPSPTPLMLTDILPSSEPVIVAEASPPPTVDMSQPSAMPVKLEAPIATGIFIHVGEYETLAKAKAASQSLESFTDSPIETVKNNGPKPYAASLGPLPSMLQANQLLDQLANAGHLISRIVIQR